MSKIVAIEAAFDWITRQAYEYRQNHLYPYLEEQGYTIDLYAATLARRSYVSEAVTQLDVRYVTGVGHGAIDCFTGYCHHNLFRIDNYSLEEVQGKIVHLLSCLTAEELGSDFISNGAIAFFGYDQVFTVVVDQMTVFFECDAEIDRALAEGLTVAEAHIRANSLFSTRANEYLENEDEQTFQLLELNRQHLCSPAIHRRWGDALARLS